MHQHQCLMFYLKCPFGIFKCRISESRGTGLEHWCVCAVCSVLIIYLLKVQAHIFHTWENWRQFMLLLCLEGWICTICLAGYLGRPGEIKDIIHNILTEHVLVDSCFYSIEAWRTALDCVCAYYDEGLIQTAVDQVRGQSMALCVELFPLSL